LERTRNLEKEGAGFSLGDREYALVRGEGVKFKATRKKRGEGAGLVYVLSDHGKKGVFIICSYGGEGEEFIEIGGLGGTLLMPKKGTRRCKL